MHLMPFYVSHVVCQPTAVKGLPSREVETDSWCTSLGLPCGNETVNRLDVSLPKPYLQIEISMGWTRRTKG